MSEFIKIPFDYLSFQKRSGVCGIGINDADYKVLPRVNGKQLICPYYQRWVSMIKRCYSEKTQERQPTYKGCTVCDEWLTFSNFKVWMEKQDWRGKQLDKDVIMSGNKVYSPDYCSFITQKENKAANAKSFTFISPCGDVVDINNLSLFCSINGLSDGCMHSVKKGLTFAHKGWRYYARL